MTNMTDKLEQAGEPPAPFPVIRATLRHKRAIPAGGAAGVAVLVGWLAYRTGLVDLYPIALILAVAAYLALRVALEVVELVAETLMPR